MNKFLRSIYLGLMLLIAASVNLSAQTVNNVAELTAAVSAASGGEIFVLDAGFTSEAMTLSQPNVDVTIDGSAVVWNTGAIKINGNGTGVLTFKELKMDGTSIAGRLFDNRASAGTVLLDKCEFYNAPGGAINISTSGSASTEIENTKIYNNHAGAGSAIWLGNAKLTINNSTIEGNSGSSGGYECGAIASKGFSGTLTLNNTIFRNNINKAANTGVLGGGGGAMSMHYFSGKLIINECLFEGNQTNGENGSKASTYDGGAIYILNMRKEASLDIKNSSFIENIAYDDGGAILIQTEGSGNGDVVDKIFFENNTFYGNKAYGIDNAQYSGGAIQIFQNVGFTGVLHAEVLLKGNTFAFNTVGGITTSASMPGGGSIGCSSGNSFRSTVKLTLDNNLFVGNAILDKNGSIIDATSAKSNIAGTYNIVNTNADNLNVGIKPYANLIEDALGLYEVKPVTNYSTISAGVDAEIIPTIPIKPEGIAENTQGVIQTGKDQRSFNRFKDHGAVEISWVKYHSTSGKFGMTALTAYDGTEYYLPDTVYYSVNAIDEEGLVVDGGAGKLKGTHPEGKAFKGWATDSTATDPDPTYAVGSPITFATENLTLYAIWGEDTPPITVTYDPNGGGGTANTVNTESDGSHAVLNYTDALLNFTAPTTNHQFKGWNTKSDGTGTAHAVGATISPTENLTLYAIWEEVTSSVFAIIYDSGIGVGDPKTFNTAKNGSHVIFDYTNPQIDFAPLNPNHVFICWKDSLGNTYTISESYVFTCPTRLVAQWDEPLPGTTCGITYHPNGGGGSEHTISPAPDCLYTILNYTDAPLYYTAPNDNYLFVNWNTKPDGSGTAYEVGANVTLSDHIDLYAQWKTSSTPDPEPGITVKPTVPFCPTDAFIHIPYDVLYTSHPLEYTVLFSDEAKNAGFKDVEVYEKLPENYIAIAMPAGVSKGRYVGKIVLRSSGNANIITEYPFEFDVLSGVVIAGQPVSVSGCQGDAFVFSVEASGDGLTYQWYFKGEEVVGATSDEYSSQLSAETTGLYYVVVSNACGSLKSDSVYATMNTLSILMKWDDVLYVDNTTKGYVKFQWYKDGQAISENGTSVYYTDEKGLNGSYTVRAYYADGTYDESCALVFTGDSPRASLRVYPNPVSANSYLTIEGHTPSTDSVLYLIELFDLSGRKLYHHYSNSEITNIPVNVSSGVYLLHVTAPNGKKTITKVMVK